MRAELTSFKDKFWDNGYKRVNNGIQLEWVNVIEIVSPGQGFCLDLWSGTIIFRVN